MAQIPELHTNQTPLYSSSFPDEEEYSFGYDASQPQNIAASPSSYEQYPTTFSDSTFVPYQVTVSDTDHGLQTNYSNQEPQSLHDHGQIGYDGAPDADPSDARYQQNRDSVPGPHQ
jgi:hypothetical protein